jgi:uncharacterized protein YbbK (DUF523 family)
VSESSVPVVEDNTRIREMLVSSPSAETIKGLAHHVVFQVLEYSKHGFDIKGVVGINRSPSCGVETTSKDNREVDGEGVFIEALRNELDENDIHVDIVGIKAFEVEEAVVTVKRLVGGD